MNIAHLHQKMSKWPFGKRLFSLIAANKAPYFLSIHPYLPEFTETKCVVFLRKRRSVKNHIGTVHAIALCNACEMAFGMTMEAGVPNHLRWIPKGMTVRYLKKAATDITVICDYPQVKTLTPGDHIVPVKALDTNGIVVMDAEITVYISERPPKN